MIFITSFSQYYSFSICFVRGPSYGLYFEKYANNIIKKSRLIYTYSISKEYRHHSEIVKNSLAPLSFTYTQIYFAASIQLSEKRNKPPNFAPKSHKNLWAYSLSPSYRITSTTVQNSLYNSKNAILVYSITSQRARANTQKTCVAFVHTRILYHTRGDGKTGSSRFACAILYVYARTRASHGKFSAWKIAPEASRTACE